MNALKTIWSEFIGLFVDDGSLAASVLIWLGLCWLVLPRSGLDGALPPLILFAGLAIILAVSALRRAGRHS